MKNRLFASMALILVFLSLAGQDLQSAPTPDPVLEQRLTRESRYRTRPRDTLERAAYYLYGRKSWWEKLRAQNPELAHLGAHDRIPLGTQLRYRAPDVGALYVVQPGDWLIRIVEWKYGEREKWEQVFAQNAGHLSNPNLIRPGDRIELSPDGLVTHRGTGVVLLNAQAELERSGPWFGIGLGLGTLVLLAFVFWLRKGESLQSRAAKSKSTSGPGSVWDLMAARKKKAVAESHGPESQTRPFPSNEEYPYGFKKRPVEIYRTDWKPAPDHEGDLDSRVGYHRIVKLRKRLGLNTKKQKKTG